MKIRKGSLSEFTLMALEKTIDGYVRFDDLIHHSGRYAYSDGWDRPIKKSYLSQAIKRLKERGLVEYEKNRTNQLVLKLTTLGQDAIGDLVSLEKEWDGIFRIVIFDIPESNFVVRNLFRRRLKDWGFKIWQRSVWVTRSSVTKKLRKLIEKLEIQDWVAVIESNDPTLKTLLKRSFN